MGTAGRDDQFGLGSEQPSARNKSNAGGEAGPSNIEETTTGGVGQTENVAGAIDYPNIRTGITVNQLDRDMSSAIVTGPRSDILQLSSQPTLPVQPKNRRTPCRRTKTGCITYRLRKKRYDEHKPSCRIDRFAGPLQSY